MWQASDWSSCLVARSYAIEVKPIQVLQSTTNPFGGVIPRPALLPEEPDQFRRQLHHSMSEWGAEGFKVVWLELPIARASLVPVAVEAGFSFHHSGEDYLMMTHGLVADAFVPPFASHYIGAGGVVLNGDELLVVHEKYGRPGGGRFYKLPGGLLHTGEHLAEGVVREVFEETGVRTRFNALVCLRNLHGYRYGKSDMYLVCRLEPLSYEISAQAEEIEECLWMPLELYFNAENVSPFNKRIVRAALESPGLAPARIEGYEDPRKHEVFMPGESTER